MTPPRHNLIHGDKALADYMGMSLRWVEKMNKKGVFDEARYKIGRRNAYDSEKILEILKY